MSQQFTVAINPQPFPPKGNEVHVMITRDVAFNLETMQQIIAKVLARLGCGGCHSGHSLDFRVIQDFVVHPKTLDVTEVGFDAGR